MGKPIFLIGYMACGKTTFGRALARKLGMDFIDLDFYIEQRFRKSIPDIFAAEGEDAFRRKEQSMLKEAGEFDDVVIACGGGTPCFFDNIDYMLERGTVIWIEATPERLLERLLLKPTKRPLIKDKTPDEIRTVIEEGLKVREPYYSRAHIRFSGEQLENRRQIDATVARFLSQFTINT